MRSAYFHRYILSEQSKTKTEGIKTRNVNILDYYALDFLDLPEKHSENDLQKAIIKNLKNFILEIGKDFCFVGSIIVFR
jgi:predicted nuclease of restriction endonuclease-like (RecB) superfamily